MISYPFQSLEILDEESVSVVPGKEDIFENFVDTFFLEAQVLCTDHRRVDQIETKSVGSVFIHHLRIRNESRLTNKC